MKKFILLPIIVLFIASVSHGQINKGSILLGGSVSFNSAKNEFLPSASAIKTSGIGISPSVGLAIRQNFILGVGLSYAHVHNTSPNVESYGGDIFLRKYLPLGKGFYLFGETSAYFSHSHNDQQNFPNSITSYNYDNTGLNFHPGVSYAVNRKIHLEIALNNLINIDYSVEKISTTGTSTVQKIKQFAINANSNPFSQPVVGFRFLFAK